MARIAGIDIPREKRVEIALTYVYGIGLTRSKLSLANTGGNPDIRVKDLSDSDVQKLRGASEEFTLEGDLRRKEGMALKRLQDIGCVRGRKDDTEETIRTRVDIYKKTTEPLIQYFKDLSLLEYIDADRDLKTVSSDIKQKMA